MTKPRVSLVIRTFNEEKHIGRLLSGVMQQSIKNVEIILVDSGSTDATLAITSRFPVKILSIPTKQFSFGRSLNVGCKATTNEFIVIVSAHVYPVFKDWLESLVRHFSNPKVALVYGKQGGDESTKFSEKQIFSQWFPDKSDPNQDHPFCNNANAAIRRVLWEKVPYNEELTGLEDIDWAKRIMNIGYSIVYERMAEVVHLHDESLTETFYRFKREAIALKTIFPEERFTLWDVIRLFVSNAARDCHAAWQERLLWYNFLSILLFRFTQFTGTYHGFHHFTAITSTLKRRFYYPNWQRPSKSVLTIKESARRIFYARKPKTKL